MYTVHIKFCDANARAITIEHASDVYLFNFGVGMLRVKKNGTIHNYPLSGISYYFTKEEEDEYGYGNKIG